MVVRRDGVDRDPDTRLLEEEDAIRSLIRLVAEIADGRQGPRACRPG